MAYASKAPPAPGPADSGSATATASRAGPAERPAAALSARDNNNKNTPPALPMLLQNKVDDIDRHTAALVAQRAALADILLRARDLAGRRAALAREEAALAEQALPHLAELHKG